MVESPLFRATLPTFIAMCVGVLSGTLVTEITTPFGLAWRRVPYTVSVYGLLALTAAQIWISRVIYDAEREVMRFAEAEYCIAYIRSRCLPELAERSSELIRKGHGGEFKRMMDEIREVLR